MLYTKNRYQKRKEKEDNLSPHFSDVFENHVAVPVESPNTAKEFPVVAAIDQHLSVVLNTHHQNRKGSGVELLLFGFPLLIKRI